MDIFLERFLPLIENSGKTDKELEKIMELPRSIIYDWKHGRNKSSFKKYASNFAKFFNVSTDYLLGNTDSPIVEVEDNLQKIIDIYSSLNDERKRKLFEYANDLAELEKYKKDTNIKYAYRVARTKDGEEPSSGQIIQISDDMLDKLRNAPESDID